MTARTSQSLGAATLIYNVDGDNVTKAIQKLVFGAQRCRLRAAPPRAAHRARPTTRTSGGTPPNRAGESTSPTRTTLSSRRSSPTTSEARPRIGAVARDVRRHAAGGRLLPRRSLPDRWAAFNANPFTPITEANYTRVGAMRLAFSDGENGVLTLGERRERVKAITRLSSQPGARLLGLGPHRNGTLPSAGIRVYYIWLISKKSTTQWGRREGSQAGQRRSPARSKQRW